MLIQRYQYPLAATAVREQVDFDYVMQQVGLNLKRLQEHTRLWPRYLSRSHLLLRLLHVLPIDLSFTDAVQEQKLLDFALQKVLPVDLFTPVHKGGVVAEVFFENRCPEIIFVTLAIEPCPIRCLRHPFESLNFWTNEPVATEHSEDIAVFSIDLLALVRSYRNFLNQHQEMTPTDFLYRVLLPSLLEDIAFITFINRFNSLLNKAPTFADEPRRSPFFIDYNDRLDEVIRTLIGQLLGSDGHPVTLRAILPLLRHDGPRFPRIPLNSNTYPLCFLCEAHFLTLLLTLTQKLGSNYLNAFKMSALTELRSFQTGRMMVTTDTRIDSFLSDELARISELLKTHR